MASQSSSCSHLGSAAAPPSPLRSALLVPFSWEKQPGVPKHSGHHHHPPKEQHRRRPGAFPQLPLPPPLRSNSSPLLLVPRKKGEPRPVVDSFALALVECSREDRRHNPAGEDSPGLCDGPAAGATKGVRTGRRATSGRFGLADLYASCKTTCSVADAAVHVRRSERGTAAYGLLARTGR